MMICGWVGKWGSLCVMDGSSPTLAALFAKVVIVITTITIIVIVIFIIVIVIVIFIITIIITMII